MSLPNLNSFLINNWWLEVGRRHDRKTASPQPIEDALIQVCIGVSGLIHEQDVQWYKTREPLDAIYVPIVITNAKLYVAMYDLADIDLKSGSISQDKIYFGPEGQQPEEIDYLLVDYGVSRGITPEQLYDDAIGVSPVDMEKYHKRSVYIVNSSSIPQFFSRLHLA